MTPNPHMLASTCAVPETRRSTASLMIQTQVATSRRVSTNAEMFSTFPWPYGCSLSGGRAAMITATSVRTAASMSSPECAASERMPRLFVFSPTTSFSPVIKTAASTEERATRAFSRVGSLADMSFPGDLAQYRERGKLKQRGSARVQSPHVTRPPPVQPWDRWER